MGMTADNARHWLMQGSLCILLALVVGLSALVVAHRRSTMKITLEPPQAFSTVGLSVCVPRGWHAQPSEEGLVLDRPAAGVEPARRILIRHQWTRALLSPLEYLQRIGLLRDGWWGSPHALAKVTPQMVSGWPGIFVTLEGSGPETGEPRILRIAAVVLPSREAILLRLDTVGTAEASDEELLRAVAESIFISGSASADRPLPPAPAVGEFTVGSGIHITLPDHLLTLPREDDFRTGLRLHTDATSPCVGIELIPCLFLPQDNADTFATMLACRDARRPVGGISKSDERTWVSRTFSSNGMAMTADYLLCNPDGQALLAEFHGDMASAAYVDQLWAAMESSVRFAADSDVAARLEAGAKAAHGFQADPPVVLAGTYDRYLYWDKKAQTSQRPIDMGMYPGDKAILGKCRIEQSLLDGGATETLISWRMSNDLLTYEYEMSERGRPEEILGSQRTELANGSLTTIVRNAGLTTFPQPAQYVPGALLPQVLGRLRGERLILRIESCLVVGNAPARGLLILIVDPGAEASVRLIVNGTGEVTRWHFDTDGHLQLIELPDEVQIQHDEQTP